MRNRSMARRVRGLTAAMTAAALLAAGCSSSGNSSGSSTGTSTNQGTAAPASGGTATADKTVADVTAPVAFTGPGNPFKVTTSLRGKTFYFISAALSYQFTQIVLSGMKAAA